MTVIIEMEQLYFHLLHRRIHVPLIKEIRKVLPEAILSLELDQLGHLPLSVLKKNLPETLPTR